MNVSRKELYQIIGGVTICILVIAAFTFRVLQVRINTTEIFNKGKFTIGKITQYKPKSYKTHKDLGQPAEVYVEFWANNTLIKGKQSQREFYVPAYSLNTRLKYLVVFDSILPQHFRILINCPIKDSTDYISYLKNQTTILKDLNHISKESNLQID